MDKKDKRIKELEEAVAALMKRVADLELALELLTANVAKQTGIAIQFSATDCDSIDDDDVRIGIPFVPVQDPEQDEQAHTRKKKMHQRLSHKPLQQQLALSKRGQSPFGN